MQPDTAWARKHGVEQALAAKDNVLGALDHLCIDFDRLFEAGNVAGIDDHLLSRGKLIFNKVAVNLGKSDAAARKLLHDEAFAAKDAGLCLSIKMNAQLNTAFGSEERALLQNPAFVRTDLDRDDTTREARAKRDHSATVRGPDVLKHAFARDGL